MRTETAMAAALNRAGLNTAEARLRMLALDAMKQHHNNRERALKTFERNVDGDVTLIREALAFYLAQFPVADQHLVDAHKTRVGDRKPDDDGGHLTCDTQHAPAASSARNGAGHPTTDAQMAHASPFREPSASQLSADIRAKTVVALTIFDRELTHTGRRWGNVCYRELDSMMEDGSIAEAIKQYIGHRRGYDRNKMIRELITPLQFHGILRKVGRTGHAA